MMTPALHPTVREADARDIEWITHLINRAFEVEAFFAVGNRTSEAQVRAKLEVGAFFVAELHGRVVGCVHVERREGARAYIGMLAVDPSHQRMGIGPQLMQAAEQHCVQARCVEALITVINLRTELRPFYHRLGYVEHGTAPYSDAHRALQPVHFIVMRKRLARTGPNVDA